MKTKIAIKDKAKADTFAFGSIAISFEIGLQASLENGLKSPLF